MFLDFHRTVFTFLSLLDLLDNVLTYFEFSFLVSSDHFKATYTGLQVSQTSKIIYSELSKFVEISFQDVAEGIGCLR